MRKPGTSGAIRELKQSGNPGDPFMKQFVITPAMGKRLIGKGLAAHPAIGEVLQKGTLVIVAGSTNGYVAEEVLARTGQAEGFTRVGFCRGEVFPPDFDASTAEKAALEGDVVLVRGVRQGRQTIFDVAEGLRRGDVILKGANAVNLSLREAGVLIGHPVAGTAAPTIAAAAGRHVRLIVPVGVEKRVDGPILELASRLNRPDVQGPGMLALPGEVFTELDAISLLTGAAATLVAAGGVYGAEGAAWVGVDGTDAQIDAAGELIGSVSREPPCRI